MDMSTIDDLQADILTLPGRPPFMLAQQLAQFYEVEPKRIAEQVKRNPERFPEDFCFELADGEMELLRSQNATANSVSAKSRYLPLAFTEAGAIALSGVFKTRRAAEVTVLVARAFVAMRRSGLLAIIRDCQQLKVDLLAKKPLWLRIETYCRHGWDFEAILKAAKRPRWQIVEAIGHMRLVGVLSAVPAGTPTTPIAMVQGDLFARSIDAPTPVEAALEEMAAAFPEA